MTYTEAKLLVSLATGDDGCVRWEVADDDGVTVAHYAAQHNGLLSEDFDQWELRDNRGTTVAHEAAYTGTLPVGFDRWDMANETGQTVAHVLARGGDLPEGFDRWEMADKYGDTVAHAAAVCRELPEDVSDEILRLKNNNGRSVAQAVLYGMNRDDVGAVGIWPSRALKARVKRIVEEEQKQQGQGTDEDDPPTP